MCYNQSMNEKYPELTDFIEKSRQKIIELQTLLSSIPAMAPESGGDGELKKCLSLKAYLIQNGFKEEQFSQYDAPDSRVSSKIRPNLILTVPGKSSKTVWVMSHLDVVFLL